METMQNKRNKIEYLIKSYHDRDFLLNSFDCSVKLLAISSVGMDAIYIFNEIQKTMEEKKKFIRILQNVKSTLLKLPTKDRFILYAFYGMEYNAEKISNMFHFSIRTFFRRKGIIEKKFIRLYEGIK